MNKDILDIDQLIGWNELLTEEERTVRDMVGRFIDARAMPRIGHDWENGHFPRELIPEMASLGILGANLTGYGCPGISNVAYGLACHEVERCDSGLRSFVSVQTSLAMYAIWAYGSEEQKNRWLPQMAQGKVIGCFGLTEPNSGSDPASMTTRCKKDGDDWLLNGTKMWITNAQIADVAVVWAREGEAGSVLGFIVERGMSGFVAHDIPHKMSMRASFTGSLTLDDVRVPEASRLPKAKGIKGPLGCLENARFGVAFGVVGAARDCLERSRTYAMERQQFGKPIAAKQLIQAKLADMADEVVKASLLSVHYGRLKDKGKLSVVQVSLMKRNNCRMALDIARKSRALMGANGITVEYGVIRHALNLESTLTYEGTDEVHTLVLGRALTGENAF
jgi:glutaryl-CoA dehydrogenase